MGVRQRRTYPPLGTLDQEEQAKELEKAIKAREQALNDKVVGPTQEEWEKKARSTLPR